MSRMKAFVFGLVLLMSAWVANCASKTEVELFLSHLEAKPGTQVLVGLRMKMPEKWHSYWLNPGESGEATKIRWELPEGWSAGGISFPKPEKHLTSDITTYVHYGEVVHVTSLTVPQTASLGRVGLKARVSWQECSDVCIRGKKDLDLELVVGAASKESPRSGEIQKALALIPPAGSASDYVFSIRQNQDSEQGELRITQSSSSADRRRFDFFPGLIDGIEISGQSAWSGGEGGSVGVLSKRTTISGDTIPSRISGLIVYEGAEARWLDATLEKVMGVPREATNTTSLMGTGSKPPLAANAPRVQSLPLMVVFAFLGGFILNFMPCVLPVIALKVLGFVNQSNSSKTHTRVLGMSYGIGVLVSFLVLSLLAISAQKAGGLATWGMALQNQTFRAVLTIIVVLVALNLFGIFEITLNGGVMGAASQLTARSGVPGAFFNGVLATILATPCTAPFLGIALAFAFTQPALITVGLFLAAGLGLAFPFVMFCWNPSWLRWLPRPGVWMQQFKVAMGFPMLATAIWLFWFAAPRYGKSGVLWFGLFLVILSMAAWIYGEFVQRGGAKRLGLTTSIALVLIGYFGLLEGQLNWRVPPPKLALNSLKEGPDGIDWQPWSPEAVLHARKQGKVVLVDFTADNCLNCQVNKKTSLEIPQTREKLKQLGAVALLGDFTDEDPAIARELQHFQRAGVPLVVVYPPDLSKLPIVLPVILTPKIVMDALNLAQASEGNGS